MFLFCLISRNTNGWNFVKKKKKIVLSTLILFLNHILIFQEIGNDARYPFKVTLPHYKYFQKR